MIDTLKAAAALFIIGLTNPMLACLVLGSLVLIGLTGFTLWFSYRIARAAVLAVVHIRRGVVAKRQVLEAA